MNKELRDILERICVECGFPTPTQFLETKAFVNHQFPDFQTRQAFLGTMVESMCKEFGVDPNELLDKWKEMM